MRRLLFLIAVLLVVIPDLFGEHSSRWQQEVRYHIETQVDTSAKKLLSYMELVYKNNSPDTLKKIFLQVPANAFSDKENTAVREMTRFNSDNVQFEQRAKDELTINSVQFLTIGEVSKFPLQAFHFTDTVLELRLPSPLFAGDSMKIGVSFEQSLKKSLRKDENKTYIHRNSWLPLIAVYDSSGWQAEPFHFMMESSDVFSEFADFDVTITVPWHYTILTSGVAVDGDPGWSLLEGDTTMTDSLFAVRRDSLRKENRKQAQENGPRTVKFKAEKSHNFVWLASPNLIHYQQQHHGKTIDLFDRATKKRRWIKNISQNIDSALIFHENWLGPYPEKRFSIVNRYGMSQPKMICSGSDNFELVATLTEAIIPARVSVNTIKEGWLSKGLTFYLGKKFNEQKWGKQGYDIKEAQKDQNFIEKRYPLPSFDQLAKDFTRLYMSSGQNEAISQSINHYSDPVSYFFNAYLKADQFYEMLEYVIGDSLLQQSLQEFATRHSFQHIGEIDLRRVCEEVTGEDLGWFFEQWLYGTPTIDYKKGKVKKYQRADKKWVTEVEIEREGDGVMPVEVDLELGAGQKITKRFDGFAQRGKVIFVTEEKPKKVKVDPGDAILDNNQMNNGKSRIEIKPDLPLLQLYYMPGDTYLLLWRPLIGYNSVDGLKLGLRTRGSYRTIFNQTTLELEYGFLSNSIDGKVGYSHPIWRDNMMHRYEIFARKNEGRFEMDAQLRFRFSKGILAKGGQQIQLGINFTGVQDLAYLKRTVTNNQTKSKILEWQDLDIFQTYANAHINQSWHNFDTESRLSLATAFSPGDANFSKVYGRTEGRFTRFGLTSMLNLNYGAAFGKDRLPLQEKFNIALASPVNRFRHNTLKTSGDWQDFEHRFIEGGARLYGYAGRPLPLEKYASYNFELGLTHVLFGTRWFAFYNEGLLWTQRNSSHLRRADGGIGFRFFDFKSMFFGGNLPLFENLSLRVYFPFWVSHPLPGEEKTAFRWFVAFGKKF